MAVADLVLVGALCLVLALPLVLAGTGDTCGGFGEPVVLSDHDSYVNALAVDDQFLYSGSADATVRVWDLANELATYKTLRPDGSIVNALQAQDGLLTVGTQGGSVILLDAARGTFYPVGSRLTVGEAVNALLVHEGRLYVGTWGGKLFVYGFPGLESIDIVQAHSVPVLDIFAADGLIHTASKDNTVRVWNATTLEPVRTLTGHLGNVYRVLVHDGLVYTGSYEGSIGVWRDDEALAVRPGPGPPVLALTADDRYIYAGYANGFVRVLDPATWEEVAELSGHRGDVHALVVDGRRLYSGAWDDTVFVWQLPHKCGDGVCGKCEQDLCCQDCGCPGGMRCSRDVCCPRGLQCCADHADCGEDEFCGPADACITKGDDGAPCASDVACRSGSCSHGRCCPTGTVRRDGTCAPPARIGGRCTTDFHCADSSCSFGRCCPAGAWWGPLGCRTDYPVMCSVILGLFVFGLAIVWDRAGLYDWTGRW